MSGIQLRFINTSILIIFILLTLTGIYGLFFPYPSFLFEIHRIGAWALILLIPWKAIISFRSLGRGLDRHANRNVMIVASVVLAIATLIVLVIGLMWKWNLGEYYLWIAGYGYSAIGWHWGIALYLILPLFLLHLWRRWPHPRKTDFLGRRQVLKLIGLGLASIATWTTAEVLARTLQSPESSRRFTGSWEAGSFTGNDHPVTSGSDQGKIKLDPSTWKLKLTGAVKTPLTLTYAEALDLSLSEVTATLDCTGGWYTTQIWRGIPLIDLLAQAQEILLATYVGDQVLDHVHGYPMRAVVPSRRGWHWVKWLTEIEVLGI